MATQAIAECIEALDYESAELRESCVQLSRLLGVHKGIHTEGIGQS